MAIVNLQNVTYKYPLTESPVLHNLNLQVNEGEFVAIVGPNGAGKSTLCYTIAGFVPHFFKGELTGSVIVDVSIDQGGNCAATVPGRETRVHDVCVCGTANIPGSMAVDASWLYAHNMLHYVENLFSRGPGPLNLEDEIVRHSLVTIDGRIVHPGALKAMGGSA